MIAVSLWHINNKCSELKEEIIQDTVKSNQKMISTKYSMLSNGTEFLVSSGLVHNDLKKKMAVPYMGGDFNFPIKYGYACSGLDKDEKLYHFMHPHQNKCIIDEKKLFEIKYLSALKTPLISNMETVLNGIWDAELQTDDDIAIIGYGNIGCLLAQTLKKYKQLSPSIIEIDEWRAQQAENNGFSVDRNFRKKYDVIYNTSSSNQGLEQGLKSLKFEGKLIEMSWYGDKKITLTLGREFHYNRLQIISSQVSSIPKKMISEMDYLKRKKLAATILENKAFDSLITNVIDFSKAPLFFNDLRNKKINKGLIYLFKY